MAMGRNGFGPGLFFYTKRGETEKTYRDGLGIKSTRFTGYSVIRKFYSPSYNQENSSKQENDFRSTIYWNPLVRTDSTGMANISFYNSDNLGTMNIVVEGISQEGKLCRGIFNYQVFDK
jgi:hypothetical protein